MITPDSETRQEHYNEDNQILEKNISNDNKNITEINEISTNDLNSQNLSLYKITSNENILTQKEINKIWLKVDLRILPISCILYLASYIDRANIANARILGMQKDLNLTQGQYNWALSIFFIGYVIFETPSNILLKRIGPRWYIPTLTILWGMICALISQVKNGNSLLCIRFFLGVVEAGFLPGIIFWIGSWYPRELQGRRFAILYSTVSLTGAFGGLLATAIHALDGTHNIAGWKWIFIVEGVITTGLGLCALCVMVTYPENAKFLSPKERAYIVRINIEDRAQHSNLKIDWYGVRQTFTDYRTYLWGLVYLSTYIPVYSVILSLPSVVVGLGYSGTIATLMACPPYGFGFIIVLICGYTSDKYKDRYWHYIIGCIIATISLIVLATVKNNAARYVMFFLMMFMFLPISIIWSWLANNVAGPTKRAVTSGLVFSCGNIGGTVSGQIYRSNWAPYYWQGHVINIACYVVAISTGTILYLTYIRDNAARDKLKNDSHINAQNIDLEKSPSNTFTNLATIDESELGKLGDRHPLFRYYV